MLNFLGEQNNLNANLISKFSSKFIKYLTVYDGRVKIGVAKKISIMKFIRYSKFKGFDVFGLN
ncbi:MAG: hypothetical protein ACR2LT_02295, partial [Pyrinomonadaceae bacterium]